VLLEKYDSVEIGSLRSTLASTITGQKQELNTLANNTKRMFAQYSNEIGELVDEATAWLTSGDGYVVATKDSDGNWKEMLFMDTNDITTATNVLRVNQNGIGFSSTGVAGPYTQAWTLDGHLVIGGTNVPSLTVYDNSTPPNIIFQTSASGTIWNSTNSNMTTDGTLTAKGSFYCGGSSTGQSSVNVAGGQIAFGYEGTDLGTIKAKHVMPDDHDEITIESEYVTLNATGGSYPQVTIGSGDIVNIVAPEVTISNNNRRTRIETNNNQVRIQGNSSVLITVRGALNTVPRISMDDEDIWFYNADNHGVSVTEIYNYINS
jgi:hypothetical protein